MAQFSDTDTEKSGLVQMTDFLLFGSSTANTTDYPLADKTRNINKWYRTVMAWILQYAGNWSFDDSNYTDLPIARGNVTSGQNDYTFPTDSIEIEMVTYKDSGGIWHKVEPIDRKEIGNILTPAGSGQVGGRYAQAPEEFLKTNGTPLYYDKFANSIWFYPAPNRTSTDGDSLRIYHTRDASRTGTTSATGGPFLSTDTTKEPGFNRLWHPVLAYGAAYDYAIANMPQKAPLFFTEIERYRIMIETHYATRKRDERKRLQVIQQDNR